MSSSDRLAANMRATTEALVYGFNGQWTVEAALAPRAPECLHVVLPTTLGIPPRNNEEWKAYFTKIAPLVWDAKMVIHDYLAVPAEHRAVCWSAMTATTKVGPFSNEYIWFLRFNESGSKIVNITEFMDRKAAGELLEKLRSEGYLEGH